MNLLTKNLREWSMDILLSKGFDNEHFNRKNAINMYENLSKTNTINADLLWSILVYQSWNLNN